MPDAQGRLTVVLVDDEAPARALLREYLGEHADVTVGGECANGFEAVKTIADMQPDLVFLDVQMPKLDGFEVLELLDPGPLVIFATAYDEHALRAFEVNAVDYLLKHFGRERLAESLDRARARARAGGAPATPGDSAPGDRVPATAEDAARLAAAARPPGRTLERILVRDGGQVTVIPIDALDYLEAQDDYIAIHALGKSHLKTQRLAELAAALDADR